MPEIWLHTNRRAISFALIPPTMILLCGVVLYLLAPLSTPWLRWLAIFLATVGALFGALLLWQLRIPRLARRGDELLFYMRAGAPFRVPLELVEGFLMGQAASYLRAGQPDASQVATIVIRLADRATDYAKRDVKPALGAWCNHYVTIRGTWCEPLSLAVVTRLNNRLAEAHAKVRQEQSRG